MDPLSISVSALTVIATCANIAEVLNDIRKGSSAIDETIEESLRQIRTIGEVVQSIKQLHDQDRVPATPSSDASLHHEDSMINHLWKQILTALKECSASLTRLEQLVKQIQGEHADRASRLEKLRRYLRKTSKDSELYDLWQRLNKTQNDLQLLLLTIDVVERRRSEATSTEVLRGMEKILKPIRKSSQPQKVSCSISTFQLLP
jgi:hypothetical protein